MISHLVIYLRIFHALIRKIESWLWVGREGVDNKEQCEGSFELSHLHLACGNASTPFPNTECIPRVNFTVSKLKVNTSFFFFRSR